MTIHDILSVNSPTFITGALWTYCTLNWFHIKSMTQNLPPSPAFRFDKISHLLLDHRFEPLLISTHGNFTRLLLLILSAHLKSSLLAHTECMWSMSEGSCGLSHATGCGKSRRLRFSTMKTLCCCSFSKKKKRVESNETFLKKAMVIVVL